MGSYQTAVILVGSVWAILVGWWFRFHDRTPTSADVSALLPWLGLAGIGYGLRQVGASPPVVTPFVRDPLVYAVVLLPAVLLYFVFSVNDYSARLNAGIGTAVLLVSLGVILAEHLMTPVRVAWIVLAIGLGLGIGILVWRLLIWGTLLHSSPPRLALATISAHALDATTTAVGIAILGGRERNPFSRILIELGRGSPVASLLGSAWLFVLVKLLVVAAVVVVLQDGFEDTDWQRAAIYVVIASAGLGPAVHNIVVFASTP